MIRPENADCQWRRRGFKTKEERRSQVVFLASELVQEKQDDANQINQK